MDFIALGQQLLGLGLPILGNALGGPLGGAVASIIAKAIGAPDATPASISATLASTNNDLAIQRLRSAEAEYVALVTAQSAVGQAQLTEIGETMRAEIAAALTPEVPQSWPRRLITFMQLAWRPILTYQTILEFAVMDIVAVHELWTGDTAALNAMIGFSGFLTWYFAQKMAVIGIYSIGRSAEKIADTNSTANGTAVQPEWIKSIVNAVKGKK